MPCFKGLAVSIHTADGPLPEYAVQKASRLSRISTYIVVPPPRLPTGSSTNRPEPSTFAVSITLLTPGQDVPYSVPKPTAEVPYPEPKVVGSLPGHTQDRGKYSGAIGPYVPLTTSPNETVAAYIYFDGRSKEEVATLLRRGEETWVNSRWVGVPESEGGGLAEREFLFREVGLERWLNGLDLDGKDAAATIERRRQKLEKRRRKRKEPKGSDEELDDDLKLDRRKSTLRYGVNGEVEDLSDDDGSSSGTGSSDDDPMPEATGQIKVALFRVLASGEIKRGEYSPQFDAHDDDDDSEGRNGHNANGGGGDEADVDHTTSFAKPKTLDPKSISTQTVTGIDPTDKPYAVFTFLYRGERQLQKMGILKPANPEKTPVSAKRRSVHADFSSLGPLKKEGTVGFTSFRDRVETKKTASKRKSGKRTIEDGDMESDSDDDDAAGVLDVEDLEVKKEPDSMLLSPEDAERAGKIADGVRKMKLKRQHSAEPVNGNGVAEARKRSQSGETSAASSPNIGQELSATPPTLTTTMAAPINTSMEVKKDDELFVGSPMKRHRASIAGLDDESFQRRMGSGSMPSAAIGEILSAIGSVQAFSPTNGAATEFGGKLIKKEDCVDEEI